jgi:hypothetical protein
MVSKSKFSAKTQTNLPNAAWIHFLAIMSIMGSFCFGFIGLFAGIAALIIHNFEKRRFNESPGFYNKSSLAAINGSRIVAIIGIVISCFVLSILLIGLISQNEAMFQGFPWKLLR